VVGPEELRVLEGLHDRVQHVQWPTHIKCKLRVENVKYTRWLHFGLNTEVIVLNVQKGTIDWFTLHCNICIIFSAACRVDYASAARLSLPNPSLHHHAAPQ
jgi:hypothetical protein